MTGDLQAAISLGRLYAVVTPILADLLRSRGDAHVVDLASGGGGPWPALVEHITSGLGRPPSVTLTDLQPNLAAAIEWERLPGVSYRRHSVSVLAVPREFNRIRTMFTGLHHFDEGEVTSRMRAAQHAWCTLLVEWANVPCHGTLRGLA
jgi:hypothetical protein